MERINEQSRVRDERGASAIEYGLLIAGVAAVIVLIVFSFGNVVTDLFGSSCGTVAGEITGASC